MLIFGTQRKIITLDTEINDRFTFINEKAKQLFSITSPFVIQHFDEDFEEWVDTSEDHIYINKEKLQICKKTEDTSYEVCS